MIIFSRQKHESQVKITSVAANDVSITTEKWKKYLKQVPLVNFINILRAAFAPISLRQKITKLNCS